MSTQSMKAVGDVTAGGITIAAIMHHIPEYTAVLSLVWVCLQIYTWVINKRWKRVDITEDDEDDDSS